MVIAAGRTTMRRAGVSIELIDPALAHRVYVSSYGNDAAIGSPAHPVKTPTGARNVLRTILPTQTRDAEVRLLDHVQGTLVLSQQDSAKSGYTVTWLGDDQISATPKGAFDNRNVITDWTLFDSDNNIWIAEYSGPFCRSIWIDDVRALRCRRGAGLIDGATWTETGYSAAGDAILSETNVTDVVLLYNELIVNFNEPHNRVASVVGNAITMVDPAHTYITVFPGLSRYGHPADYAVRQDPEDIEGCWADFIANTSPGSFYYDRINGEIYYIPRPGEDLSTAVVTAPGDDEVLISVVGDVRDVTFKRVGIHGANFKVTDGFAERAAGYGYGTNNTPSNGGGGNYGADGGIPTMGHIPAAVEFSGCSRVHLTEVVVAHNDGSGVHHDDNTDCQITRYYIHDIGCNGIQVGDMAEVPGSTCTSDGLIDNGVVHDVGMIYRGGIGIRLALWTGSTLKRALVYNCPYIGIMNSYGWEAVAGWNDKIGGCKVMYCIVHDAVQLLGDGAGYYFASRHNGTGVPLEVAYNYGYNIRYGDATYPTVPRSGAYLDGDSFGIDVHDTLFFHCLQDWMFNGLPNPNSLTVSRTFSENGTVLLGTAQYPDSFEAIDVSADPRTTSAGLAILAVAGPSSDILSAYGVS